MTTKSNAKTITPALMKAWPLPDPAAAEVEFGRFVEDLRMAGAEVAGFAG